MSTIAGYLIEGGRLIAVDASAAELFDGLLSPSDPAVVALRTAEALTRIDADVDAIYAAVVGNRSIEYTEAEADASDFAAANFAGTVPQSVAAYSAAAGLTDQQAAEAILAQASAWRAAVLQIRTARLAAKAGVRAGDIDAALSTWSDFVAQMRAGLGV